MSNLLVTIMAIALVALTSITGIWYGGDSFLDNRTRAEANQAIGGANQIAQAWRAYAFDNGGDYELTDANWLDGTATDLVPRYLSELPFYPFAILDSAPYQNRFNPIELAGNNFTWSSASANAIALPGIPEDICKQINAIGSGTASAAIWTGWNNTNAALADLKPFHCGADAGGTTYYFIYLVFKQEPI